LAKNSGARVFVTSSQERKLARCRELGADFAINYKEQDFLAEVWAETGGEGVDLILDPVGGAYLDRNVKALRQFGRLVNIGLLGGGAGQMNVSLLLRKRLRLIGSTLRSRPLAEKIAITQQFEARFWPKLASGELQPIIDTKFPIEEAQAAHEYVAQDRNVGKVILTVS
jgi:NADPH:quinone reductase